MMNELRIVEDKRNELLARKEIKATFTTERATPSKAEIAKELAKQSGAKEESVEVKHIYQKYGKLQSEIIANIYDKEAPKKKAKKGDKPAEGAAAEKKE